MTTQFCAGLEGCVRTVTLYAPPLLTAVLKVKLPLVVMERLSPPLSCNTSPVPERPETVPPMVNVVGVGGGVLPPELPPPQAESNIKAAAVTNHQNIWIFILGFTSLPAVMTSSSSVWTLC